MAESPIVLAGEPKPRHALSLWLKAAADRIQRLLSDSTARKGVLALVDQALFSGTNFLTIVIIGRTCLPESLGVYQLVLSIVLMAYLVQDAVIGAPYRIYCHQRSGRDLTRYTGSVLVHQGVLAASTVLCLLLLLASIGLGFGPQSLRSAVWALLPAAPFLLLREFIRRISFARLRMVTAVAVDATVATLQLGTLGFLAWHGLLSVGAVYVVIGGSCAAATLGWFVKRDVKFRIRRADLLPDWKHNWSFSKWTLGSLLVANGTPIIVLPWFLAFAHGESATGVLAACAGLVGLSNTFLVGIDNMLGPKTAESYVRGGVRALTRLVRNSTAFMALAVGAFCLAIWIAGDLLPVLVYGDHYTGTSLILAVLALNVLAAAIGMAPGNGLWAIERPSSNFAASLCDLIATLVAAACLILPLGVLGAALAILAGTCCGTVMRWMLFLRYLSVARTHRIAAEGGL